MRVKLNLKAQNRILKLDSFKECSLAYNLYNKVY